jgi:hypothetical protein
MPLLERPNQRPLFECALIQRGNPPRNQRSANVRSGSLCSGPLRCGAFRCGAVRCGAVRCIPFWQEAAPVVGWRWWRWCWRRWWLACVASCPGAEDGVGDAARARVPAVPAGASPEMVRGRLRSGVRRGAARRRPCPAFAWRRGRWEPRRRCPSAAPDLLLPSLSRPPRCGWLPCRARNVSGPGGRQRVQAPWPLGISAALPFSGAGSPSSQPLEASPLRLVALSRPQRLWPRRPSARKRASGGQDGATLRRQGNQDGALSTREPASRKATPHGTRLRVRELAAHRRRIHCSAKPPIRLRSSASPQPRIHAPDRRASRDADS